MEERESLATEERESLATEESKKETVLENADKWYNIWLKLPKIAFWITVVLFFIWGIVDPCVFYYKGRYDSWYGVMECETGFTAWFIWQIIGWALAGLDYAIIKLATAPIILQTECLKEIRENTKNK